MSDGLSQRHALPLWSREHGRRLVTTALWQSEDTRAHEGENWMTEQTVTLAALQGQSLEEFLHRVAQQRTLVTVLLPDGHEIMVALKPRLKPLPMLEGHVPAGWKDAVYGRD